MGLHGMVIGLVWLSIGVFSRLPMGATEPSDWIAGNMESIVALYRHFHVKTTSKTTSVENDLCLRFRIENDL